MVVVTDDPETLTWSVDGRVPKALIDLVKRVVVIAGNGDISLSPDDGALLTMFIANDGTWSSVERGTRDALERIMRNVEAQLAARNRS